MEDDIAWVWLLAAAGCALWLGGHEAFIRWRKRRHARLAAQAEREYQQRQRAEWAIAQRREVTRRVRARARRGE